MSDIDLARLRAIEEHRFPMRHVLGVPVNPDDPAPAFPPLALRIDINAVLTHDPEWKR